MAAPILFSGKEQFGKLTSGGESNVYSQCGTKRGTIALPKEAFKSETLVVVHSGCHYWCTKYLIEGKLSIDDIDAFLKKKQNECEILIR